MAEMPVVIENSDGTRGTAMVHFVYASEVTSDPGEPDTFEEAWYGDEKIYWRPSHVKEIMNFTERGSWH
jgi:hypothetical protein